MKKILITTGIFPPVVGGPAQYAKNLKESLEKKGFLVTVKTYTVERALPVGIRHLYFFFKILPAFIASHGVITLDTFSVGLPSVLAGKLFGKKVVIRTGGDFLWEQYVERTKKQILLKNFYETEKTFFSRKEKIIFFLTGWALRNASSIVFSSSLQRDLWISAYELKKEKTEIIENYYGPKETDEEPEGKVFLASSRGIFLKNELVLDNVFKNISEAKLVTEQVPFVQFMEKMKTSYGVIVISLSEISPNIILDAIRLNRPFICTREVGIYDRIKDVGLFVDPLNYEEIRRAVQDLLTEEGYAKAKEKVRNFNFVHTWDEIASEFIFILERI